MSDSEIFIYSYILVILFLRSKAYPGELHRREARKVLTLLLSVPPLDREVVEVFEGSSLWHARVRLRMPGILSWAKELVAASRVLTLLQEGYPSRLLEVFGDSAPVAFWKSGAVPLGSGSAVCGSRHPPREAAAFAAGVGEAVARSGRVLVSGGAEGCDLLAERGALENGGSALRFLPHGTGLSPHGHASERVCQLSLVDPDEPFSTANAMERNLLIHASSDRSLVVHARFREGGTWHGVQDALRRRVTRLFVPECDIEPWSRGLVALGARRVSNPEEFVNMVSGALERYPVLIGGREGEG